MLHILWIFLKTILIILGILLGLVLLALLLLLFCPVRYQAQAKKEGEHLKDTQLAARVSWLFRAVGAKVTYENGEMKLTILIFGISLDRIRGWMGKISEKKRGRAAKKRKAAQASKNNNSEGQSANLAERSPKPSKVVIEENDKTHRQPERGAQETVRANGSQPKPEIVSKEPLEETEKSKMIPEKTKIKDPINSFSDKEERKSGFFFNILEKLKKIAGIPSRIWNRIASFIKGIHQKLKKIRETIGKLQEKAGWWRSFLEDEKTKAAISLVWKDGKALIRHILPTKIEGQITFGCEDPAITGTALAALGMTFPLHKNRIQVNPLFDGENRLTGNVSLKGRMYGVVFVKTALEIYINKNIKYVINRWKHKED